MHNHVSISYIFRLSMEMNNFIEYAQYFTKKKNVYVSSIIFDTRRLDKSSFKQYLCYLKTHKGKSGPFVKMSSL